MNEGPADFYPAVCLKYHVDPTLMLKHVLPEVNDSIELPLDPRPWSKIAMEYRTSGTNEAAPVISASIVFPSGGSTYEPNRYLNAITNESDLRRLNQPLRKCDLYQYLPPINGDMFNNRVYMKHPVHNQDRISNLSMPKVLMTTGPDPCRSKDDSTAMQKSGRLFFNATKQDRYVMNK